MEHTLKWADPSTARLEIKQAAYRTLGLTSSLSEKCQGTASTPEQELGHSSGLTIALVIFQ